MENHGLAMEKRHGCRPVCAASFSRRVGGLGGRKKGCAEHFFWAADALGVHPVRAGESGSKFKVEVSVLLPALIGLLCSCPDEQADDGDMAICPGAARFLAAEKSVGSRGRFITPAFQYSNTPRVY